MAICRIEIKQVTHRVFDRRQDREREAGGKRPHPPRPEPFDARVLLQQQKMT